MADTSDPKVSIAKPNLRRRVLPLMAVLTLLWMLNAFFLGRGEASSSGLRRALDRFGYNPETASLLESDTLRTPFGLEASARFLTEKGVEVEIHGKRTLAFLDWRVTSLVSWGK